MMSLNLENLPYLPTELVHIIADYHDYDKYYKPSHKSNLSNVLYDIHSMASIMKQISPKIAKECWGTINHDINSFEWEINHEDLDEDFHHS